MTSNQKLTHNEGVVADNINAQVLAVGKGAKAVQILSSADMQQFRSYVAELKQAVDSIEIPIRAKTSVSEHVEELAKESEKATPDRGRVESALKTLSSSAKLLSEFVSSASIIIGPIAKIAAMFGLAIV